VETPPSWTVVVIGDSMADWLGYGLDEKYTDRPEIGVDRKIRASSGLIHYDAKNESLDWPQAAKEALSKEKPNAIVVMQGLNDRVPLREKASAQPKRGGEPAQGPNQAAGQASQDKAAPPIDSEAPPQTAGQTEAQRSIPGGQLDFHTDQWAALYTKRIDEMIAALKSKGVPVIWVGLPAIRGTKGTSDMRYLDGLYRERAERAGITYVEIWDGFVDEDGDYAVQGPDFEGQTRRLSTADGVHFTRAGAVKIASYVDRELQRVIPSSIAPVALPGPEAKPKSGPAGARPDVGPVLPLTVTGSDHSSALLGAGDHKEQTTDPIAAKVLSRGESLTAPAGRADVFLWPRPGSDASAPLKPSPEPVAVAPDTLEMSGTAAQTGSGKHADARKDAKEKPAINSHASARIGPHRYYNYHPGRDYGYRGHHYSW
jgi:lysophospholipase L1-like esterase